MTRCVNILTALCALAIVIVRVHAQGPEAAFRSVASAVRIDVSVQQRGRPVTDLKAEDFEILDNGARQTVANLSYEKLPIDVTLALDMSTSVNGPLLDQLRRAAEQLRSRLKDDDRLKLVTFNMRVRRVMDFADRRVNTADAFGRLAGAGSTSLFDTIAVSLISAAPADRRQLIIAFSDGQDTSSFSEPDDLIRVARRTTPTVAFVLPAPWQAPFPGAPPTPSTASSSRPPSQTIRPVLADSGPLLSLPSVPSELLPLYAQVAWETGGALFLVRREPDLAGSFGRVLDDFRSSYVLYFSPTTRETKGFHALDVKVTRAGAPVDVRARRGYVAD